MGEHHTSAGEAGWCLRFAGGAAKGRTLALRRGANLLGSAGECDVVLAGADALPRHLLIQTGEWAATVQRIDDAALRLNGDEVVQRRRGLQPGDVLTIGGLELQVDRYYGLPEAESDQSFGESILVTDGDPLPSRPARTVRRAGSAGRQLAAGLMALAALALASGGVWRGISAPDPATTALDAAAVRAAIGGFDEVELLALPQGRFLLRGYVESRARKLALEHAVESFGRQVSVSVHTVDDIVEQARRYIASPAIAISYQGQGRLNLAGTSDEPALRRRVQQLAEDLQPAVTITDRVRYRDDRSAASVQTGQRAAAGAWQQELPARVVGVTQDASGVRHLQLANGSRYYEGTVLRSGIELEHIDPARVDLGGTGETHAQ